MKNLSILTVLVLSLSFVACQSGAETTAEAKPAAKKEAKALTLKNSPAKANKPASPEANKLKPEPMPAPEDVAAAPADAITTPSGLASKVIVAGSGTQMPKAEDTVEVHYTGWTADGKMFDSSVQRDATAKFPLNRVIKGWTEGLQLMVVGEKRRFWIPGNLAYGDTPTRPGAPSGTLVFDVKLISIKSAPKPIVAPADVAAVPADAKKTQSGIGYKVLNAGKGEVHPKQTDKVEVHYTGWTTDGKMFDSSVLRGKPAQFPLYGVIKGWTEGVQLMVPGEKTRFWIPAELAYGNKPGRPAGMLVFDIELLKIL
jgi:peptidylprolyl isomerase